VGGKAQTKAMRQVAGKLRLDMAQFRELAAFAQFGTTDLDKATKAQLERGQRVVEILKQPQYNPMSLGKEVTILYAVTNGYLDDITIEKIAAFESEFHRYLETSKPEILKSIENDREIKPETEQILKTALIEFKQGMTQ
jgi:F-type H+-transporting ATPase subunit alpha